MGGGYRGILHNKEILNIHFSGCIRAIKARKLGRHDMWHELEKREIYTFYSENQENGSYWKYC
jgi:hypothetical protein